MIETQWKIAKITLKLNENSGVGSCAFCCEEVEPIGFDFMVGSSLVCYECAKRETPELIQIFEDAREWMEAAVFENVEYARRSGRRSAANSIFEAAIKAANSIFEAAIKDDPNARDDRAWILEFEKAWPEPDVDEI